MYWMEFLIILDRYHANDLREKFYITYFIFIVNML